MANHQASEQMIGYVYQIRYALYLLLESDDVESNISIEKFDDIAFTNESGLDNTFIQLKHHTKNYGNLTNSSVDIWRTLNAWINEIRKNARLLDTTKFLIITTAQAPASSASSLLTTNKIKRDTESAFELLKQVAEKSTNASNSGYYKNFIDNISDISKKLVNNIYIIDNSSNVTDTSEKIKKILRYSCEHEHINSVFERLEGWWTNKSIEALSSPVPIYVNPRQIQSLIVNICREYSSDNLPIDIGDFDIDNLNNSSYEDRLFYEQLRLIKASDRKLNIVLRDYIRAFEQRSKWVRDDLLYINELDRYETRLVEEWEHCYTNMLDEIENNETQLNDVQIKYGRLLLKEIEDKDIRIRERCSEPFIMRGSYHMLADQLRVGWHADFKNRLTKLVGIEVVSNE